MGAVTRTRRGGPWPRATALAAVAIAAVAAAAPVASPSAASTPQRGGEPFPDPMRPSPLAAPAAVAASAAGRPERSRADGRPARLQSVLIGEAGARAAVIDGTVLAVGDRLGEARLVSLTERSAVLAGPQGQRTTLLLIPGVDKHDAAAPARSTPAAAAEPATAPGPRSARPRAHRATETSP